VELLHTDTTPLDDINARLDALAAGHVVRRLFRARDLRRGAVQLASSATE
jgi:hypothetical protein